LGGFANIHTGAGGLGAGGVPLPPSPFSHTHDIVSYNIIPCNITYMYLCRGGRPGRGRRSTPTQPSMKQSRF